MLYLTTLLVANIMLVSRRREVYEVQICSNAGIVPTKIKPKYPQKTCPSATLSIKIHTMTHLGSTLVSRVFITKRKKFQFLKSFLCQKQFFIVPTDAHCYKNHGMLKQCKIITLALTCFGSRRNHHQGAVLCLAKTTNVVFSVLVGIDAVNVTAAYKPVVRASGSQCIRTG